MGFLAAPTLLGGAFSTLLRTLLAPSGRLLGRLLATLGRLPASALAGRLPEGALPTLRFAERLLGSTFPLRELLLTRRRRLLVLVDRLRPKLFVVRLLGGLLLLGLLLLGLLLLGLLRLLPELFSWLLLPELFLRLLLSPELLALWRLLLHPRLTGFLGLLCAHSRLLSRLLLPSRLLAHLLAHLGGLVSHLGGLLGHLVDGLFHARSGGFDGFDVRLHRRFRHVEALPLDVRAHVQRVHERLDRIALELDALVKRHGHRLLDRLLALLDSLPLGLHSLLDGFVLCLHSPLRR